VIHCQRPRLKLSNILHEQQSIFTIGADHRTNVEDLSFLGQICGHTISPDSPAGTLITTYLAANREPIKGLINWYYEKTTEAQRTELHKQNPRVDPSTLPAEFQSIALHIVEQVTTYRWMGDRITKDGVAMTLRAFLAINDNSQSMDETPPSIYRLVLSPVEAIWPAWQAAYAI
jgi:hypothetical protein